MRRVDRNLTNFAADVSGGQRGSELCSVLLELPEDTLRLDFPGVPAAHQMVLQDRPGGEGEVADLTVDQVVVAGRPRHCRVAAAAALCRPAALLGGGVGRGAGVGGHAEEGTGLG